jgi:hypothetical protein
MNLKFIIIFVSATVILAPRMDAQDVVVSDSSAADTLIPKWGIEKKNSLHIYFGAEMLIGESEGPGADIIYGLSLCGEGGFRYKYKI